MSSGRASHANTGTASTHHGTSIDTSPQLRPYVPPTSHTTKRAGCTLSCVISHCASVVHSAPITMPVSATASGA
ncbi:hypothetical protein BLA24064_01398 [Burkholderia latens]|uniref:Uncharacterized protein n=1 Tax=Burkholderia latens TaxID=488446 RepID=A0A6P2IP02_9BURK|nr:hypothetical protein BLA24064_01398 [Burkholderia latens]